MADPVPKVVTAFPRDWYWCNICGHFRNSSENTDEGIAFLGILRKVLKIVAILMILSGLTTGATLGRFQMYHHVIAGRR